MARRFAIIIMILVIIFGGVFGYHFYQKQQRQAMAKGFRMPPATVSTTLATQATWANKCWNLPSSDTITQRLVR